MESAPEMTTALATVTQTIDSLSGHFKTEIEIGRMRAERAEAEARRVQDKADADVQRIQERAVAEMKRAQERADAEVKRAHDEVKRIQEKAACDAEAHFLKVTAMTRLMGLTQPQVKRLAAFLKDQHDPALPADRLRLQLSQDDTRVLEIWGRFRAAEDLLKKAPAARPAAAPRATTPANRKRARH